ncbi:MAG: RNA ligase (ATP) [Raineya sp.]|jgi:RNA ligase (TIGR02306 family)|nr:RNA ligase (ATP) [Raineya sp.]
MRKLASIQKIKALDPIPDADAIMRATVLGWELVVKKDEFKEGELCVYCEIDSILPNKPEFEFLKPRGMRIRTIRLRGQISQGICFPLSVLPEGTPIEEDLDVTDVLGVIKYEPPIPAMLAGVMKSTFPSFIPKTDETRVQVLQKTLDKYQNEKCFVTEKLDGSSVTYYLRDEVFGVCSRNMELEADDENTFWAVARTLNVEEKLKSFGRNIALQGELIGEGVQGNKYALKGQTARFFNIYDIDKSAYVDFNEFESILKTLDLPSVPILETDYALSNDIHTLIEKSKMRSTLNDKVWAEGIVIRPLEERHERNVGRVSFKAINPEFLLKYE